MKSSTKRDVAEELDATEKAKLKKIVAASDDLEVNMKAAHAQCRKVYAARRAARKNVDAATLEALRIAYGTYAAASTSKAATLGFLKAAGLSLSPKTSSRLLNTVIKTAISSDRRRTSWFATVIKSAIRHGVAVQDFDKFVKSEGGVTKCVELYRKAAAVPKPKPKAATPQLAVVEMSYGSPAVEKALEDALAKAKKLAKTLKRQAIIAVSRDGSCELMEVRGMPKP